MPTDLLERTTLVIDEAPGAAKTGRRLLVQVITPGWGSSGYYGADVLKQAGKDRVFKAGTHIYLDHPTESEKWERPARSVRDLAGILTSDARWNGTALVAEAEVFEPYRAVILGMKDAIGMSIRASAEAITGKAEGRSGTIVTRLLEASSVDFVTKAGRGGRILQVLESAYAADTEVSEARNLGQWLESRIHQSFTNLADDLAADGHLTREERIALSSAIGDALATFASKVETEQPHLYDRDPFADPTASPAVAEQDPTDVPSTRLDESHPQTIEENLMDITESEHARLTKAAERVDTLEADLKKALDALEEAKTALAEATKPEPEKPVTSGPRAVVEEHIKAQEDRIAKLEAREGARAVIGEVLAEAWLGDVQKSRLQVELMADLPLAEGKLDEVKLRDAATKAVNEAETEAAEILKAAGVGSPRGLGAMSTPATEAAASDLTQAAEAALSEAFGLSESAAKTAVKGR